MLFIVWRSPPGNAIRYTLVSDVDETPGDGGFWEVHSLWNEAIEVDEVPADWVRLTPSATEVV